MNNIDKLLVEEKAKSDLQSLKQRKILRIIAIFLLPIFLGIGFFSFLSLFKALSKQKFIAISAIIIIYSLLAGLVEYIIKTKTKNQNKILSFIVQVVLFGLLSVIMIRLIEN